MHKIAFVDRDGVINVDLMGDYVKSWEEFRFEEGAIEGLLLLQELGYTLIVISNQAGIGDGVFKEDALWDTHNRMIRFLEEKGIRIFNTYFCLHGKDEGCSCRKPETGLLEKAVEGLEWDRASAWFIGDKFTDITAGRRFGIKTFFVRTGHGKHDEKLFTDETAPDRRADNLLAAAEELR